MQERRDPASGLSVLELAPDGPRGLALVLHGRGANKEDLVDVGEVLARDGWSVVLPDAPLSWGPGFAWYDSARSGDLSRARELVTKLLRSCAGAREFKRENVLLCGFSQGGVTSLDVALHEPALVARVACLSGYLSLEDAPAGPVTPPVSVFMAHGTADDMIGIERAREGRDALAARGVAVSWHEYPMPHTILPEELKDLRSWLGPV